MHHQVVAIVVTGLFALRSPKNKEFHNQSTNNQRFCAPTKSLFQIQEGDDHQSLLFVDQSGDSWRPISESGGFCNQIYDACVNNDKDEGNKDDKQLKKIMKVYSDVAMKRMELSGGNQINFDKVMGDLGIGPAILKSTENYVIMEKLVGRVLSNEDLLTPPSNNSIHLQSVARALAKLHCVKKYSLEDDEGATRKNNMLWLCCNALLERLKERGDEDNNNNNNNNNKLYHMYSKELRQQQMVLEGLGLPLVLGHGDFKPSNVMLLDGDDSSSGDARIKVIDWETCGLHYRAYDLAKFFRAVEPRTKEECEILSRNHVSFIDSYCKAAVGELSGGGGGVVVGDAPSRVLLESKLLLPMTWLEAALFFHCKSYDEEEGSAATLELYTDYAEQRLVSYQKSLKQWEMDVHEYKSLA